MTDEKAQEIEELRGMLAGARQEVVRLEQRFLSLTGRNTNLPAEHGTDTGYYAHRKHWGSPACQPCKDAHATVERIKKRRKKGQDDGSADPTLF